MSLHLFPTATDGVIDLSYPHYDSINVLDIAWALSQINRFYGHAIRPYSVAEHSLLVCDILAREGADVHCQLAGLMHDAHEAYCNDLHPWTKKILGWAWTNHEEMLARTVRTACTLQVAWGLHQETVTRADKTALAIELRDMRGRPDDLWAERGGQAAPTWVQLDTPERAQINWEGWRDAFVDRYHQLNDARNALLRTPADTDAFSEHTRINPGLTD